MYQTSLSTFRKVIDIIIPSSQHVFCQNDLSDIIIITSSQHIYCKSYDLSDIIIIHLVNCQRFISSVKVNMIYL